MALANQDNSRRAYLQWDFQQSRTTQGNAVTWFNNGRAGTTPRPEREKGRQFPEDRDLSREGQFGEETWLSKHCLAGRGPQTRTCPPLSPFWALRTAARDLPSDPMKAQGQGRPRTWSHLSASSSSEGWWKRVQCGVQRSRQDLAHLAQNSNVWKLEYLKCKVFYSL